MKCLVPAVACLAVACSDDCGCLPLGVHQEDAALVREPEPVDEDGGHPVNAAIDGGRPVNDPVDGGRQRNTPVDGGAVPAEPEASTEPDASVPGVDAGPEAPDAAANACDPVPQRPSDPLASPEATPTPASGLSYCDPGETFLVDELPERCELIGDAWPGVDAGSPVPCNYDCSSGWCHPDTNDCLAVSECTTDADCPIGHACLCSSYPGFGFNKCVPAGCSATDECGPLACAVSHDQCGVPEAVACHTAEDECWLNSDCGFGSQCGFVPESGRWECMARAICD